MSTTPVQYDSIESIKAANEAAGFHYFSPATMRHWQSRILSGVIGGRYFITSEARPDIITSRGVTPAGPRLYTIREALPDGSIDTVGDFQGYVRPEQARRMARRLAAIPADYPVRPLIRADGDRPSIVTDGACGLSWDDDIVTSMTPTPAGRCPFEQFHGRA